MQRTTRPALLACLVASLLVGLTAPATADPAAGWKDRGQAHRRGDAAREQRRDDDRRGDDRRHDGDWRRHDGRSDKRRVDGHRDDRRHDRHWRHDDRFRSHWQHDRRHDWRTEHRHDWRSDRWAFGATGFYAPRHLTPLYVRHLERYRWGQVWDSGHHHHHAVFSFPVWVGGAWAYRPYSYCGSELVAVGVFTDHGPSFSFRIGF